MNTFYFPINTEWLANSVPELENVDIFSLTGTIFLVSHFNNKSKVTVIYILDSDASSLHTLELSSPYVWIKALCQSFLLIRLWSNTGLAVAQLIHMNWNGKLLKVRVNQPLFGSICLVDWKSQYKTLIHCAQTW